MDKQWIADYLKKMEELYANQLYLESRSIELHAMAEQCTIRMDKIISELKKVVV